MLAATALPSLGERRQMQRSFARSSLAFATALLVALVCTTTAQTARADGPAKRVAPKAVAQVAKPKPKPAAKPAAKTTPKPQAKATPKPAAPQKIPRALTPKEEPEKPAAETPKEGDAAASSREEKAGKVDGRKWRPRPRG